MKASEVVHIVDDDDSVRIATARLLQTSGLAVKQYSSAGQFLVECSEALFGCLLLDIRMPGPSGLQLQEHLAKRGFTLPIIFMTAFGDIPTTVRAMKAGAFDFLTKPVKKDDLLASVKLALAYAADRKKSNEETARLKANFDSLSPREREVYAGVVAGKLNKQIAGDLGTAERTVKAHRAHLMQKMGATSLAELVHISTIIAFPSSSPARQPPSPVLR
jgi:FixJ family two-component response regulator